MDKLIITVVVASLLLCCSGTSKDEGTDTTGPVDDIRGEMTQDLAISPDLPHLPDIQPDKADDLGPDLPAQIDQWVLDVPVDEDAEVATTEDVQWDECKGGCQPEDDVQQEIFAEVDAGPLCEFGQCQEGDDLAQACQGDLSLCHVWACSDGCCQSHHSYGPDCCGEDMHCRDCVEVGTGNVVPCPGPGEPPPAYAYNLCTIESCDVETGNCVVVDKLAGGECDDLVDCTVDGCDWATGSCTHELLDTPECNVVCQADVECDDGNCCTTDVCVMPAEAQYGVCQHDDGIVCPGCEQAVCDQQSGQCAISDLVCDDENPCTEDSCDCQVGCLFAPLADSTWCGPGENHVCVEGQCICEPDCEGKECGWNGCDAQCGTCEEENETCSEGQCICPYVLCEGVCCPYDWVCVDTACKPWEFPPDVVLSFGEWTATGLDVMYESTVEITSWEFWVSGTTLTDAYGGATEDAGMQIIKASTKLMALSPGDEKIPDGSGLLIHIEYEALEQFSGLCLSNLSFVTVGNLKVFADIEPACKIYQ